MTLYYAAYINTPGYLPDDGPVVFASAREAWDYLVDERIREEESSTCSLDTCTDPDPDLCPWSEVAEITDTVTELEEMRDLCDKSNDHIIGSVTSATPGYHGDHDLGKVYSVGLVSGDDD